MNCPDPKCSGTHEMQVNCGAKTKFTKADVRRFVCRVCGKMYETEETFRCWIEDKNNTLDLFNVRRAAGK